jgi:hypothetical protein
LSGKVAIPDSKYAAKIDHIVRASQLLFKDANVNGEGTRHQVSSMPLAKHNLHNLRWMES